MQLPQFPKGQYFVIRADGTEEIIPEKPTLSGVYKAIGCECVDTVTLNRDAMIVMLVDDNGYETECVDHGNGHLEMKCTKARKPVNKKATELYHSICRAGTTHQIVGDVAIVNDGDF